jgi:hypothetical protein
MLSSHTAAVLCRSALQIWRLCPKYLGLFLYRDTHVLRVSMSLYIRIGCRQVLPVLMASARLGSPTSKPDCCAAFGLLGVNSACARVLFLGTNARHLHASCWIWRRTRVRTKSIFDEHFYVIKNNALNAGTAPGCSTWQTLNALKRKAH